MLIRRVAWLIERMLNCMKMGLKGVELCRHHYSFTVTEWEIEDVYLLLSLGETLEFMVSYPSAW